MDTMVFDFDDVFLDLNKEAFKRMKVLVPSFEPCNVKTFGFNSDFECITDISLLRSHRVNKNLGLGIHSPEQKASILSVYADLDTFKSAEIIKGSFESTNTLLTSTDTCVKINTQSFSKEIADYKDKLIEDNLGRNASKVEVVHSLDSKTPLVCDYVVEDCIPNTTGYSDNTTRVIINRSWNDLRCNIPYIDKKCKYLFSDSLEEFIFWYLESTYDVGYFDA